MNRNSNKKGKINNHFIARIKAEKEINDMFGEITKEFKENYKEELIKLKSLQSEIDREKKLKRNPIYSHFVIKLIVMILLILLFEVLFFKLKKMLFAVTGVFLSIILIILMFMYQRMINEEVERNKKLKDIRAKLWKEAIENIAKGYSCETYIQNLLVFHKNSILQKIFVAVISMSFTALIVCLTSDFKVSNILTLIVMIIVNIVAGFCGNIITNMYSED